FLISQFSHHHRHLHSFPTRRSSDLRLSPRKPPAAFGCPLTRGSVMAARRQCAASMTQSFWSAANGPACASLRRKVGSRSDDPVQDRKSTRLNSSHRTISYAVFCLKK